MKALNTLFAAAKASPVKTGLIVAAAVGTMYGVKKYISSKAEPEDAVESCEVVEVVEEKEA